MLEVDNITGGYGSGEVLHGLSFTAAPGEILCVMGRNGAGKTTAMRAIMGQIRQSAGTIRLDGNDISDLPPHRRPRLGIGYVPQGRRLFPDLTVAETIELGLMARGKGAKTRDRILTMFPRLEDRLDQLASTLSGGEQQMLATARALCLEPRVLLLDEPTEGLQPSMIAVIRRVTVESRDAGVAVVLVEQRVDAVREIADRVVFVEHGQTVHAAGREAFHADDALFHRYVGV